MSKKITDEEFKNYYEENPDVTQEYLAQHFKVTQATISKKIKKIYGSKENRLKDNPLTTNKSLPELIKESKIYPQTHSFYIKTKPIYIEHLKRKLSCEYNSKNPYHIIDIIKCEHGLLVITNDLLLGDKLKELSNTI